MPRHSSHYRLGAPEDVVTGDFTSPAAPLAAGGGFLSPKNANLLLGAGLLIGLGVVGYYVWKGGSLTELWSRLTAGGEDEAAPEEKPLKPWERITAPLAPLPAGTKTPIGPISPAEWGAPSVYTPARTRGY